MFYAGVEIILDGGVQRGTDIAKVIGALIQFFFAKLLASVSSLSPVCVNLQLQIHLQKSIL
jgi:hypothetical protein